jgi:methionyl-tRNA formyltransferase
MIVVAAFGQILRPHVLDLPPLGCINVRASLLPRWRGAAPIQYALLAGDAETGVSLMPMDVGLDTGPVYVQQAIPIAEDETAASLHDKLAQLGATMTGQYLDQIAEGMLTAVPQDSADSTYAPMINKEDGQLDWHLTSESLERRVRAMKPWPGAFTYWQGELLKVLRAKVINDGRLPQGEPGTVVDWGQQAVVLTQNGGLALQEIQLAGKRAMVAADFLRGRPELIGTQLGTSSVIGSP